MTDQSLPTRSQLNGAMEFFASFAGAAYEDGGLVELETGLTLPALRNLIVTQGNRTTICLPEEMVQGYIERWLRANWEHVTDDMVDAICALEDPVAIEDRQCPKVTAHGEHYWDVSDFPEHYMGPVGVEWHCEGIKAHPRCMIMGGRDADA